MTLSNQTISETITTVVDEGKKKKSDEVIPINELKLQVKEEVRFTSITKRNQ